MSEKGSVIRSRSLFCKGCAFRTYITNQPSIFTVQYPAQRSSHLTDADNPSITPSCSKSRPTPPPSPSTATATTSPRLPPSPRPAYSFPALSLAHPSLRCRAMLSWLQPQSSPMCPQSIFEEISDPGQTSTFHFTIYRLSDILTYVLRRTECWQGFLPSHPRTSRHLCPSLIYRRLSISP